MGWEINGTFLVITIVLLALIILTLIVMRFGKVLNKNAADDNNSVKINDSSNYFDTADNEPSSTSNEELIAVLTAAVAASLNDSFANGFRVKSFRRVPQSDSLWNTVARNEQVLGKLQF